MNKKILFYSILFTIAVGTFWIANNEHDTNIVQEHSKTYPYFDFFNERNYPESTFNFKVYQKSLKKAQESRINRTEGEWAIQGPGNIGARVNTLAVHPTNDNIIYAGFSHGGIYKTEDLGLSWTPLFDDQISLAISHISIDPNNGDRIFVGTGDKNISGYPFAGSGVYKSENGGESWNSSGLEAESIISKISVSHQNPDILYAGAMGLPFERSEKRGLYKSVDGGDTWEQKLFVTDSTGIIDLVIDPTDDNVVYAASWDRIRSNYESIVTGSTAKIFKSTDGGDNWQELTNGLPSGEFSRISLYLDESNPDLLIAGYVAKVDSTICQNTAIQLYGIYKTEDGGNNWNAIPTSENNGLDCSALGGFGWYFEPVRVNPNNPDDIFVLGVDLWRTQDGGKNWYKASPSWWEYSVHADKHDLQFNSAGDMVLGTDGGIYLGNSITEEWEDIENIPTTQFYRVAYNPHNPENYYGGAQDNGSTGGNASGINVWDRIYGGDGFQMVFHPNDPDIFYVETQNGGIRVTTDGGEDFSGGTKGLDGASSRHWDMPYIMSQHAPDTLYTGTYRVFRNSTGPDELWEPISDDLTKGENIAGNRYPTITTVAESPFNADELYAGTNDGNVWGSLDGGDNWTLFENLPNRYVTDIEVSPFWEGWVYVSFSGYRDNDNTAHIYLSKDYGETWNPVSGDLLDIAINSIHIVENNFDNHLVVGTDAGVYISQNAGENWTSLGNNMPIIPVYDLDYNVKYNQIIAGTFARGIMTFDLSQLGINSEVSQVQTIQKEGNWKIIPSIAADYIRIKLDAQGKDSRAEIFNSNGIIIDKISMTDDMQIIISHLPDGFYYIKRKGESAKRFLKATN